MEDHQLVAGIPLSPIVSPSPVTEDLPHEALQYLIALRRHSTERKAMQYEHVGPVIIQRWRDRYPAFVRIEHDIELSRASLELAKAHMKANALPVAEAMVQRAIGTGNQAQRAGEAVLQADGILTPDKQDAGYQALLEIKRQFAQDKDGAKTEVSLTERYKLQPPASQPPPEP